MMQHHPCQVAIYNLRLYLEKYYEMKATDTTLLDYHDSVYDKKYEMMYGGHRITYDDDQRYLLMKDIVPQSNLRNFEAQILDDITFRYSYELFYRKGISDKKGCLKMHEVATVNPQNGKIISKRILTGQQFREIIESNALYIEMHLKDNKRRNATKNDNKNNNNTAKRSSAASLQNKLSSFSRHRRKSTNILRGFVEYNEKYMETNNNDSDSALNHLNNKNFNTLSSNTPSALMTIEVDKMNKNDQIVIDCINSNVGRINDNNQGRKDTSLIFRVSQRSNRMSKRFIEFLSIIRSNRHSC